MLFTRKLPCFEAGKDGSARDDFHLFSLKVLFLNCYATAIHESSLVGIMDWFTCETALLCPRTNGRTSQSLLCSKFKGNEWWFYGLYRILIFHYFHKFVPRAASNSTRTRYAPTVFPLFSRCHRGDFSWKIVLSWYALTLNNTSKISLL